MDEDDLYSDAYTNAYTNLYFYTFSNAYTQYLDIWIRKLFIHRRYFHIPGKWKHKYYYHI